MHIHSDLKRTRTRSNSCVDVEFLKKVTDRLKLNRGVIIDQSQETDNMKRSVPVKTYERKGFFLFTCCGRAMCLAVVYML